MPEIIRQHNCVNRLLAFRVTVSWGKQCGDGRDVQAQICCCGLTLGASGVLGKGRGSEGNREKKRMMRNDRQGNGIQRNGCSKGRARQPAERSRSSHRGRSQTHLPLFFQVWILCDDVRHLEVVVSAVGQFDQYGNQSRLSTKTNKIKRIKRLPDVCIVIRRTKSVPFGGDFFL